MVSRKLLGCPRSIGVIAVAVMVLVGCSSGQPEPKPTTSSEDPSSRNSPVSSTSPGTSSSTPAIDSNLEESQHVYRVYAQEVDRLFKSGGADELPDALERITTPGGYARTFVRDEAIALNESGTRWEGSTLIDGFELIYSEPKGNPTRVDWQVCLDQSGIRVVQAGETVNQLNRHAERVEMRRDGATGQWLVHSFDLTPPVPHLCTG